MTKIKLLEGKLIRAVKINRKCMTTVLSDDAKRVLAFKEALSCVMHNEAGESRYSLIEEIIQLGKLAEDFHRN